MSIEDFDAWKVRLTEEALEYRRHDDLTTRENVSIENLLETDLVCEESVEDEYLREEEERKALPMDYKVMNELLDTLTPVQKRRYYKAKALGMSTYDIAKEEGCEQKKAFGKASQRQKSVCKKS